MSTNMNPNIQHALQVVSNDPNLEKVLCSAMTYGLTSAKIAAISTSLSKKVITNALDTLAGTRIKVFQAHTLKGVEKNGRPEKAYLLAATGLEVCKTLWPELPVRVLNPRDGLALSHSYVEFLIAQKFQQHGMRSKLEQVLPYGRGQNMRADVLVSLPDNAGLVVEIEQGIGRNNLPRAIEKFMGYAQLFQEQAHPSLLPELLFVFNLKEADLEETLSTWADALGLAQKQVGTLPFTVRYTTLKEFLAQNDLKQRALLRMLEPRAQKQSAQAASQPVADLSLFVPVSPLELQKAKIILELLTDEYNRQVEQIRHEEDESKRIKNLGELALMIYTPSFGPEGATRKYSAFPTASLQALHRFLHMPQNAALLADTIEGVAEAKRNRDGVTRYRDTVTEAVWNQFLRHMGLGSGGPLDLYVSVPSIEERRSRLKVEVRINIYRASEEELGFGEDRAEKYAEALGFMLTALFDYASELGLHTSTAKKKGA